MCVCGGGGGLGSKKVISLDHFVPHVLVSLTFLGGEKKDSEGGTVEFLLTPLVLQNNDLAQTCSSNHGKPG